MKKLALLSYIVFIFLQPVHAQLVEERYAEAELISEVNSINPGEPFWTALKFEMKPGWHIYWRNPGDAGYPVSISWDLPEGFTASEIHWPYPIIYYMGGLVNYCYEEEAYLLIQITPPASLQDGEEISLKASAEWLSCKDVCVPEETNVSLKLPVKRGSPVTNERMTETFRIARSRLPLSSSDWTVEAAVLENELVISAIPPGNFTEEVSDITFFPYEKDVIDMNAEQSFEKAGKAYQVSVPLSDDRKPQIDNVRGILVSDKNWSSEKPDIALEINVKLQEELTVYEGKEGSLILYVAFAFLGGMILNLMPCVLPVLSIKIFSFVQQANEDRRKTFRHGLIFTAGVLFSFWILAGILLLLRAGGEQLGWGFQLQSIPFLIILSGFMLLFALSMFGVFEIGTSLTGFGQNVSHYSGYWSSFMTGITATVVATPCTAPFMGSALGFALSQPPVFSLLVFTSLGLGMAFPYVVLSSSPKLLRFIPKPGAWMVSLKQFMGFLLLATVIWLLWVLSIQTDAGGVMTLIMSLLFISMGAWIFGRWGNVARKKPVRIIASVLSVILIVGSITFSIRNIHAVNTPDGKAGTDYQGKIEWVQFSPELVEGLREEGRSVFIDFTASWCLTCQVNERVAFSNEEVQEAFIRKRIVPVKADWTSRNETIARAIESYGRNSVPLYVLYPPGPDSEPVILPEILTPGIVLNALIKIPEPEK